MSEPRAFGLRIAAAYGVFFVIQGIYMPFFPLWLMGKGLDPTDIALVLAFPALARVVLVMPMSGFADRASDRASVLVGFWIAAALAATLHLLATDTITVVAVHLLLAVLWVPQLPITDGLAIDGMRRFGLDYGRIRLWGSITFLVVNLAGGWLFTRTDSDGIMVVLVALFWVAVAVAFTTPRLGPSAGVRAQPWAFVKRRNFTLVVAGAGLVQASHAFIYGFGSVYWAERGASESLIGALWAFSVFAEIVLFLLAGAALRRYGPVPLLLAGGLGAILRWLLFPFEPGLAATFGLQVLHAASFGATHLGMQLYIAARVGDGEMTSAQGYSTLLGGLAMGLASLASGSLYARFGVDGFLAMALLALAGTVLIVMGLRGSLHGGLRGGLRGASLQSPRIGHSAGE